MTDSQSRIRRIRLGAALRRARQSRCLTVPDLARLVRVHPNTLRRWEDGNAADLALDRIERIERVLGLEPGGLFAAAHHAADDAPEWVRARAPGSAARSGRRRT